MGKKLPIVHCRICKADIDRNIEKENIDWINPARNYFYHKDCYENWKTSKDDIHSEADEKLWKDAMYDFLRRDVKVPVNYPKSESQWKSLIKKGRTPKGIYFCIRYFYEVMHGDPSKAQGGIGIIDYIYEEGCTYWASKEITEKGIISKIEQQMKEAAAQEIITVKKNELPLKKKKKAPSLADIGKEDIE